jgi:uncharacterized protein (TIGR01732 family)
MNYGNGNNGGYGGYGGECCNQGYTAPVSCGRGSGFALIVVLFILLIIVGAVIFRHHEV